MKLLPNFDEIPNYKEEFTTEIYPRYTDLEDWFFQKYWEHIVYAGTNDNYRKAGKLIWQDSDMEPLSKEDVQDTQIRYIIPKRSYARNWKVKSSFQ